MSVCLHVVDVYGRLCAVKRSREERTGEEENEDGDEGWGGGALRDGGGGKWRCGRRRGRGPGRGERARAALLRSEKETRIESRSESWLRSRKEVDTR